jgi:hypothetical protein
MLLAQIIFSDSVALLLFFLSFPQGICCLRLLLENENGPENDLTRFFAIL